MSQKLQRQAKTAGSTSQAASEASINWDAAAPRPGHTSLRAVSASMEKWTHGKGSVSLGKAQILPLFHIEAHPHLQTKFLKGDNA